MNDSSRTDVMANGVQLKLTYENSECSQESGPTQAADQKHVLTGNIKKNWMKNADHKIFYRQ